MLNEVDLNMPDLLVCNDQGQVYGYPKSEDDEEETFVDIPKGVVPIGAGDIEWKLHKCLCGLNQFPNQTIDLVMKKLVMSTCCRYRTLTLNSLNTLARLHSQYMLILMTQLFLPNSLVS